MEVTATLVWTEEESTDALEEELCEPSELSGAKDLGALDSTCVAHYSSGSCIHSIMGTKEMWVRITLLGVKVF